LASPSSPLISGSVPAPFFGSFFGRTKNEQENKEKITILNTKASFIKEKKQKVDFNMGFGQRPDNNYANPPLTPPRRGTSPYQSPRLLLTPQ
jgi:hypothetical protein